MEIIGIVVVIVVAVFIANSIFIKRRLKRIGMNVDRMMVEGKDRNEIMKYIMSEGYKTSDAIERCLDEMVLLGSLERGMRLILKDDETYNVLNSDDPLSMFKNKN